MIDLLRNLPLLGMIAALSGAAQAADLPNLPSLAANPQAPPPSWKGLYIGSQISFSSFKGAKPGVGGAAFVGYDHPFDNGLILGVRASTGYDAVNIPGSPFRGLGFVGTDVKLGYDLGQLKPYVIGGVALARPVYSSNALDPASSANAFFASGAATQAFGSAGFGFDYAITNNFSVGLEARVGSAGALLAH